jgi:ATPase subunit of ABC transporter with duplicated ATPase domains
MSSIPVEAKQEEVTSLQGQQNEIEKQLKRLQDMHNARVEQLRKCSNDAYEAFQFLQSNQHLFQQEVLGPVMLTLKMKDSQLAKHVESQIPQDTLVAFVCQCSADQDTLIRVLRKEKDLRINSLLAPVHDPASKLSINDIRWRSPVMCE